MGKMALILVVGLTLSVAVVAYTLNTSKTGLVENVSGFHKYTTSRDIANTGVNVLLRRLDANDTSITNPLYAAQTVKWSFSIMSGICSTSVKLTNPAFLDTIDVTSKSKFMDTTKTITARLRRQPVPYPSIGEAVGLRVPNVNFNMTGSAFIDGRNHTIDGTLVTPADSTYKPGVGVLNAIDSSNVAAFGSKIDGTKDVVVDPGISDPSVYVGEYINGADYVYPSGIYGSNYTWGSPSTPKIIYCSGDVKFNGNGEGWGILVVDGNLTLAGTFKWHGLVVCYNTATIDVQFASGTPTIIGGVLMAGPSGSDFIMKGNSWVGYSKDALENAKYINKLQVYRVMYWYE